MALEREVRAGFQRLEAEHRQRGADAGHSARLFSRIAWVLPGLDALPGLRRRIDAREPGPQRLAVEVEALDEDAATGRAAVLRVLDGSRRTGLQVVVTARRAQFARRAMFARLGLSMTGPDVVVVKMGYLEPDQQEAAADWRLALTPGGVDQDLLRLGHARIARPMIPFDAEIPRPGAADLRR